LDLSGRCLAAAQLGPERKGGRTLMAAARMERANPAKPFGLEDATGLFGVLDRSGFEGRQVVIAAPRELLMASVLELPPRSSGAPLEEIARLELARANKCDPASFEMAMWDLPAPGRGGDATSVMAVALSHDRADQVVRVFDQVGLEVVGIDARSCALMRACGTESGLDGGESGFSAILDVGWDAAQLVVELGGVVLYERSIAEAGLGRLFEAVNSRFGVDPAAAMMLLCTPADGVTDPAYERAAQGLQAQARGCLVDFYERLEPEVERSLSYASHRYPATSVRCGLLTGDGAGLHGLVERLASRLSVGVRRAPLPESIEVPPGLSSLASAGFETALGLAMFAPRSVPGVRRAAA